SSLASEIPTTPAVAPYAFSPSWIRRPASALPTAPCPARPPTSSRSTLAHSNGRPEKQRVWRSGFCGGCCGATTFGGGAVGGGAEDCPYARPATTITTNDEIQARRRMSDYHRRKLQVPVATRVGLPRCSLPR